MNLKMTSLLTYELTQVTSLARWK